MDLNREKLRKCFISNTSSSSLSTKLELNLRGKRIQTIEPNTFDSLKLAKLDLSHNEIQTLHENTFTSFFVFSEFGANLPISLNISSSQIKSIQAKAFGSASQALLDRSRINLNLNQLQSSLYEKTFKGFVYLTDLNLSYNQLTSLHVKTFSEMTSLERLNLSNNSIKEVYEKTFSSLGNLAELDMSFNSLEHLNLSYFDGLLSLKSLNLKSNKIKSTHSNAFLNLSNLNLLDLSSNQFDQINLDIFTDLDKLAYLNLNKNKIRLVRLTSLKRTWLSLKMLDLSDNKIETLSIDVFKLMNDQLIAKFEEEFYSIRYYLDDQDKLLNQFNATIKLNSSDEQMNIADLSRSFQFMFDRIQTTSLLKAFDAFIQRFKEKSLEVYWSSCKFINFKTKLRKNFRLLQLKDLLGQCVRKNNYKLFQLFFFEYILLTSSTKQDEIALRPLINSYSTQTFDFNKFLANEFNFELKNFSSTSMRDKYLLLTKELDFGCVSAEFGGKELLETLIQLDMVDNGHRNLLELAIKSNNSTYLSHFIYLTRPDVIKRDLALICHKSNIQLYDNDLSLFNKVNQETKIDDLDPILNKIKINSLAFNAINPKIECYIRVLRLFNGFLKTANYEKLFHLATKHIKCFTCLIEQLSFDDENMRDHFPRSIVSDCIQQRHLETLDYLGELVKATGSSHMSDQVVQLVREGFLWQKNGNTIVHDLLQYPISGDGINYMFDLFKKLMDLFDTHFNNENLHQFYSMLISSKAQVKDVSKFVLIILFAKNEKGISCMDILLSNDSYFPILKFLTDTNKLSNQSVEEIEKYESIEGYSRLQLAAKYNSIEIFKFLIDKNLNVNILSDLNTNTGQCLIDELIQSESASKETFLVLKDMIDRYLTLRKAINNGRILSINSKSFKVLCSQQTDSSLALFRKLLDYNRFDGNKIVDSEYFNQLIDNCVDEKFALCILESVENIYNNCFDNKHHSDDDDTNRCLHFIISTNNLNMFFEKTWLKCVTCVLDICKFGNEKFCFKCLDQPIVDVQMSQKKQQMFDEDETINLIDVKKLRLQNHKNHPLIQLSHTDNSDLLKHPTTLKLLELKWQLPQYIYYLNILLHLLFLASFDLFSINLFELLHNQKHLDSINKQHEFDVFFIVSFVLAIYFFSYEFIQCLYEKINFFKDIKNLLETSTYLFTIIIYSFRIIEFVKSPSGLKFKNYSFCFSMINIMASIVLIMRLEKIETIGIYILALRRSFSRSLKLLPIVFIFIIGFSISFKLRSYSNGIRHFSSMQLIKTIAMMVGDYQSENMGVFVESISLMSSTNKSTNKTHIDEKFDDYDFKDSIFFNSLLYGLFFYLMGILFLNLFTGIAIGELEKVLENAKLHHIKQRFEYVFGIQNSLNKLSKLRCFKRAANLMKYGFYDFKSDKLLMNKIRAYFKRLKVVKMLQQPMTYVIKKEEANDEDNEKQVSLNYFRAFEIKCLREVDTLRETFLKEINEIGKMTDALKIQLAELRAQNLDIKQQFFDLKKQTSSEFLELNHKLDILMSNLEKFK